MRFSLIAFIFIVFCLTAPAHAQDCVGPQGVAGDLMYNVTLDVFQGCTLRGWIAFHEPAPPDPCTTSGTPGTACKDGQTVYAGSWNGHRYYTTKTDQGATAYWGGYNAWIHADGLGSLTDGLPNTNTALAYFDAHPLSGGCTIPFNPPACVPNAFILCKNLRTALGGDWYLPARDEIVNVLYPNRAAIGGFSNGDYWSSSEELGSNVRAVNLMTGALYSAYKFHKWPARCVKRD